MFWAKKRFRIILIVTFVAAYILLGNLFYDRYQDRLEDYFSNKSESLQLELESTLTHYGMFSDYFYQKTLSDDYVMNLLAEANDSSEEERNILREELFNYYEDEYSLMKEYNFYQYHFHLTDNTSFLRMHNPDKFGEDLTDYRYSVDRVNNTFLSVSGFEEGRSFTGFRYVYPLFYQGEHVGSVEITVPMSCILALLSDMYPTQDFLMIISKTVVDPIIFDDETSHYDISYISNNFYFDNEYFMNTNERNLINEDKLPLLIEKMSISDDDLMTYNNLSFSTQFEDKGYEMIMIPVENIEGNEVGYFVSISMGNEHETLRIQYWVYMISVTAIMIVLFYVIELQDDKRRNAYDLSQKDPLTEIHNRRYFSDRLISEISRSKRHWAPFSVIVFDIDHFKEVNDKYGHHKGDKVLHTLSQRIFKVIRKEDTFARIGGEEFGIILTNTTLEHAVNKAVQINALIADKKVADIEITISIGVSTYRVDSTPESILKEADLAMYAAKESGRNQVRIYNEES